MTSKYVLSDIQTALDILEMFRQKIKNEAYYKKDINSLTTISQRQIGIEDLEDHLARHAFEAPVVVLIDDFVHKMNIRMNEAGVGTKGYQLYKNMRDAAYDAAEFFL